MKIISTLKVICILTVALILITFIDGCMGRALTIYSTVGNINGENYVQFVSSEGSPFFTFEYPSSFALFDETQGNSNPGLNVGLRRISLSNEAGDSKICWIDIDITNYHEKWLGFPDAVTAMKEHVADQKWSLLRNYKLLEKHQAIVGGVEGWEIISTFRERQSGFSTDITLRPPASIVARHLFFDYNGMTWEISIYSDKESYYEQTKQHFEHILQTFRFTQ